MNGATDGTENGVEWSGSSCTLLRDPLAARRAARQSAAGIGMDKAGWTSDAQKIFAEEKIRLAAVGRAGGASFDLVLTHGSKGVPVSKG